jgi:hypothetical protein
LGFHSWDQETKGLAVPKFSSPLKEDASTLGSLFTSRNQRLGASGFLFHFDVGV